MTWSQESLSKKTTGQYYKQDFRDLYSSQDIIRVIQSRKIRSTEHVQLVRTAETRRYWSETLEVSSQYIE
jgi:hypothetical protein